MGRCDPGLRTVRELQVDETHTAVAVGSGDVPVLATSTLLALAERACVEAIASDLGEQETTVGATAEIEHLLAVPVGGTVRATAMLIGHHGRRLEFNVRVTRDGELVARIRHGRVLVERDRFLRKLATTSV